MNFIFSLAKGSFHASVSLLNQPMVKEGVKNLAGSVTFVFGLVEIYDIYQIARGRAHATQVCSTSTKWVQVVHKAIIVCAKISLILSAAVSRPGIFIASSLVGCVFSTAQLDRICGPNTLFAINPWHPRHVMSIAAVVLALPSVLQSTYKGIDWAYKTMRHYQHTLSQETNNWLPDSKVRLMALFNAITSRPTLHIGNQLGRFMLRPI